MTNRKAVILLICLLFALVARLNAMFDCGQVTVDSIAPNNPDFSDNACIIIADFTVPDCSLPPPDPFQPDVPLVMCPNAPITPTMVAEGSQVVYNDLAYALQTCPFDPVLIEFIGTIYVPNVTNFIYNQTKDLILRGILQTTVIPGGNITELQPVLNTTTNTTELVEVVVGVLPDEFVTLQSTIVGFKDLQVIYQNVSVEFYDFVAEGCYTEDGVFMTISCPERCDIDNTNYCPGSWYPKSLNVTANGLCTNTGAYFNGTQRVSFQNGYNNNYGSYNGANTQDTEWWRFNDVTVEAWINPVVEDQVGYAGVVGNYRYGNAKQSRAGYGLFYDKDQHNLLRFRVAGPNYEFVDCAQVIAPTTWTHVAGTYASGTGVLSLYINGFLVCNATGPVRPPYYGTNAFRTMAVGMAWFDVNNGGSNNDRPNYFRGVIDEVRVWNVTRTSAQIQVAHNVQVASNTIGLVGYLKFDEGPNFFSNAAQGNTPGLPTPKVFAQNTNGDNVTAVDDCFCAIGGDGLCVPTEGVVQNPPGSVTMINSNDNVTNYEFVYSVILQPNGPYGMLFIPAVLNTTGFVYDPDVHIIPGLYQNQTVVVGNETETQTCFTPGVIPSTLPPVGATYLANMTQFTPGWFFNDGKVPFSALNFVPGAFFEPGPGNATVLPECYREGDSIFVAGTYDSGGVFVPYGPMSMQAMVVAMMGGACWNCNSYIDSCIVRDLIVVPFIPPPIDVIISDLGCTISPTDPVVHYLNASTKSPCAVLQTAVASLPTGFQVFTQAQAAACTIGPHDPEPMYLNNSIRDPCFALRDLRNLAVLNNTLNCSNGDVPYPPEIMPCLKNQNLTMAGVTVQNYYGPKAVCQHACEEYVSMDISDCNFTNIPGSALWETGLHYYSVHDNFLCPCGGTTEACTYLNGNHIARDGVYEIYNNRQCAMFDLLPYECLYDISPVLKCSAGTLQCLDIVATLQEDCQQVEVLPDVFLFDTDCAIYTECVCGAETQNVTLPDGTVVTITQNTGDVEIALDFITPLVEGLLGGNDTLILSCATSQVTMEFIYECEVNVTVEMTVGNVTMNVTILQLQNCSSFQNITVGELNSLPCPCPRGFNASYSTNLTGSAAAQALGLYNQCEWDIPGGLPGEQCVDQVVWCPYAGGTLGDGAPPPPGPGQCADGTVIISCGTCTPDGFGGLEYYYDNVTQPCPGYCVNSSSSVFSAPCMCDDFYLTVTCQRDIQCLNAIVPCNGTELCPYTGSLLWEGTLYPCFVDENATDCLGISYAAASPAPPPDGQMKLPCDDSYVVPSPGPCSCTGTGVDPNSNITQTNNASTCNQTADPGCITPSTPVNTGDPALQFICRPNGQLSCRCDSIYANNPFNGTNFTLMLNSTAYWIDNVHPEARFYQQNNVAQGLPYGWRYTRFEKQLIRNFPLQVQHFNSAWFNLHESGRTGMSPYITGTVYDWVQGYDANWNFRYCNQLDPGPPEGVYDNECRQFRPSQNTSCVVDANFNAQQTPNFGTTRFARITDAINEDDCKHIIVHRATNMYEEQLTIDRDYIWVGSYDTAGIISSGHWIKASTNVTIRGILFVHTGSNDYPLIQPTAIASNNYDAAFRGDPGDAPANVKIQNCIMDGHNVNKAGAIIGLFGAGIEISYNVIRNFITRGVFVDSSYTLLRQNVFIQIQGRDFRTQTVLGCNIEENEFIDPTGIKAATNVEFLTLRAAGDLGTVTRLGINSVKFGNLTNEDFNAQFDPISALNSIDFLTLGCNEAYDPARTCYIRGNRVMISDPDNAKQFETLCYRVIGGAMPPENFRDNVCDHAKIGADFSYTTNITYANRDQIFKQNALIRVQDSYTGSNKRDSADLTFRIPGSLVTLGCFFPNCWPNTTYPTITVNPRFSLTTVDNYGFDTMNNLTAASRWGYPLNVVRVTSGIAILRREIFDFEKDLYAVGIEDPFCCKKPIFYGGAHQMGALTTVLDNLEFRFEINPDEIDDDISGNQHFETPARWLAMDIRFLRCNFDGRYTIGSSTIDIAILSMDPNEGNFVLDSCTIYNWYHYPIGTYRGVLESNRGVVPVLVLPDGTVYNTALAPTIKGFKIYFQPLDREVGTRFVKNTPKNPFKFINSMAVITGNNFTDLDGSVLLVTGPGNWYISDNRILDCGVRQPRETFLISLEGNQDSFGSYIFQNMYINNTKNYLFPYGGGASNPVLVAAVEMFNFAYPTVWLFKNITIALNGGRGIEDFITYPELPDQPQLGDEFDKYGLFKRGGPKFFNAPEINGRKPTPNRWNAADIAQTGDVDDSQASIMAGGGTVSTSGSAGIDEIIGITSNPAGGTSNVVVPLDPDSFNDPLQFIVPRSAEGVIFPFVITNTDGGYPIGVRFSGTTPPQVIVKTLDPTISNFSLFSFFQPQLYPYRIVSVMSGNNAAEILANGGSVNASFDFGPGIHGITSDIVACSGHKDIMEFAFSQCIVCNRGCPVQLPDACYVDPANATYVPENPYFGTWLFANMQSAVMNCKNPRRIIIVVRQEDPYQDSWEIDYGNWTIISNSSNPAQVLLSMPLMINADNVSIHGFEFIHNVGDFAPTVTTGFVPGFQPMAISFDSCIFTGEDTIQSAFAGGTWAGLAITKCTFNGYNNALTPVVWIDSSCGMLYMKDNTFNGVKRVALFASNFDVSDIENNNFIECGAQAPDGMPFCVYISNCYATAAKIIFAHNDHNASMYHFVTGTPRRAAYWLDGIPIDRIQNRIALNQNSASGLDIGMRVTNIPDASAGSIIKDRQATVAYLSNYNSNQDVLGSFHYIVWGEPADDMAIENDPEGTKKFYCDNDCAISTNDISVVFTLGGIGIFFIFCCALMRFQLPNPLDDKIQVSNVLGVNVVLDPAIAPVPMKPSLSERFQNLRCPPPNMEFQPFQPSLSSRAGRNGNDDSDDVDGDDDYA